MRSSVVPRLKWNEIEDTQPYADSKPGHFRANARHDVSQKSSSIFETATKLSDSIKPGQKLMPKVTVAMFDIHPAITPAV